MRVMLIAVLSLLGLQQLPSFPERQALEIAQRISASKLDAGLPDLPFAKWFEQVVGPQRVVIWQVNECGDQPKQNGRDLTACVEANSILSDRRKVVVLIAVGTFKEGIGNNPQFNYAVIEDDQGLHGVTRLRDLPDRLRAPLKREAKSGLQLPAPEAQSSQRLLVPDTYWPPGAFISQQPNDFETDPLPPPPAPKLSADSNETSPASGTVQQGAAIKRVQPRYPENARRVNASGTVEVQVVLSEEGQVIDAKAISGHPVLRDAAVEAARKWVFEPTTVNKVKVRTEIVLTFLFEPR